MLVKASPPLVLDEYPNFSFLTIPTADSISRLPLYIMTIEGRDLSFIADSGATHSVIRYPDLPEAQFSSRYLYSVGSSGAKIKEYYTVPLSCIINGMSFTHSFLLSQHCPFNLMGRDIMLSFGIDLCSSPEGMKVYFPSRANHLLAYEKYPNDLYEYQWQISYDSSVPLIKLARGLVCKM